MTTEMSKTQIDRLGDRLKKGNITEDDLRLLDQYRRSFTEAYEFVVGAIRKELSLEPTGRPAKSTTSIADKLRRESIRLTQIQDIAGCRLIGDRYS
jgi:putative GTP pyrophosphokinase